MFPTIEHFYNLVLELWSMKSVAFLKKLMGTLEGKCFCDFSLIEFFLIQIFYFPSVFENSVINCWALQLVD